MDNDVQHVSQAEFFAFLNQQRNGLRTPLDDDHTPPNTGAWNSSRDKKAEALNRLKEAVNRGDLDFVETFFEGEQLPNSPMEMLDRADFPAVLTEAIEAGHEDVAAYLLSQDVLFTVFHIETAVEKGFASLLWVFSSPQFLLGCELISFPLIER